MKRLYILLFSLFLLLTGCQKEIAPGNINIEFQFDSYDIDLNVIDNPSITCMIRSDAGLESVTMYLVRQDGSQIMYKEPVTDFFNPKMCSIHESPVYEEDYAAFKIVARDLGGAEMSEQAELKVSPVVMAPTLIFDKEELAFEEGDPIPDFSFEVNASAPLSTIVIELVTNVSVDNILDSDYIEVPGEVKDYVFNSSEFELHSYDLTSIPKAIRVTVVDAYGKTCIAMLSIRYKSLPSPTLSVNPLSVQDEFESCEISGVVSSETGISSISYYTVGEKYENLVGVRDFESETEVSYSFTVNGNYIRDYVTGIKVVAKDARNKESEAVAEFTVNPKYTFVKSGDNLQKIMEEQLADEMYRNVKLELEAGAEFSLSTTVKISKNILIKGQEGGERPVVASSSAKEVFNTEDIKTDIFSVRNVLFRNISTSSIKFIDNPSKSGVIDAIEIRGCRFEGYKSSLIRLGASMIINAVTIEDCVFDWKNTGGSGWFHIVGNSVQIGTVKILDSTISGVTYMLYCNMRDRTFEMEISNCSFVNFPSTSNPFINIQNGSMSGSIRLRNTLFGGSNAVPSSFVIFKTGSGLKLPLEPSDNWCTPAWRTFSDPASLKSIQTLPAEEDNGQLFRDVANLDLTITPGTSVYNNRIGDPRWIR